MDNITAEDIFKLAEEIKQDQAYIEEQKKQARALELEVGRIRLDYQERITALNVKMKVLQGKRAQVQIMTEHEAAQQARALQEERLTELIGLKAKLEEQLAMSRIATEETVKKTAEAKQAIEEANEAKNQAQQTVEQFNIMKAKAPVFEHVVEKTEQK